MSNKIIMTLTVDWEGEHLKAANLDAMKLFNEKFPEYPLTHFICPAYYTRGEDPAPITEAIRSVIKPGDEIGLHVHCWYTLMDRYAGRHIATPTWLPNDDPGQGVPYDHGSKMDYGHDVPLGLFTRQEIAKTLVGARQLLAEVGLIGSAADCTGFRCGGWMACDKVFEALADSNFEYDASGAPSKFNLVVWERIRQRYGVEVPLFYWISLIWGPSFVTAPDYMVNLRSHAAYPGGVLGIGDPAISGPAAIAPLMEVPDTGSLADYTTFDDLKGYIDTAVSSLAEEVYISMGFHQETAADDSHFSPLSTNIQILTQALQYLQSVTTVEVMTRSAAAHHFQTRQAQALQAFEQLHLRVG